MIRTALALTLAAGVSLFAASAQAQGTLRIGMTASDIPLTTGQTDQGGEGMRFMGYTVYDALINWDLSKADKASDLTPGLATSWARPGPSGSPGTTGETPGPRTSSQSQT